jgi:hypothetical protein
MIMKKLAFATLVAMGMTAAAIAQQPGQQPAPTHQRSRSRSRDGNRAQAPVSARRRSHRAGGVRGADKNQTARSAAGNNDIKGLIPARG